MIQNKNSPSVREPNIYIDKTSSKIPNIRISDIISNMISTGLRKSKKCVCISHKKTKPDKNAYDFAQELIEKNTPKNKRRRSTSCRRGGLNDPNVSQVVKELLLIEEKMFEKANRIMNNHEMQFNRNIANENQKEILGMIKNLQKKVNINSTIKQKKLLKTLMEGASKKKQEVVFNKNTNQTQSFYEDNSVTNPSQSLTLTNSRKKSLKTNLAESDLQSLLNKERKRQVWKAFQQVERKNAKKKKSMGTGEGLFVKKEPKKHIVKKKRQMRYQTEGNPILDISSPAKRRVTLQNYYESFNNYVKSFTLEER